MSKAGRADAEPVLVVAALSRELSGIDRTALPGVEFLQTGMGRARAAHALRERLGRGPVKAVIGLGFAGALSAELRVGDIVLVREVLTSGSGPLDLTPLMPPGEPGAVEGVRFGVAVTADEIAVTAQAKRALAELVPAGEIGIVDMESSAVAEVCRELNVQLLIARCISDLFDEDLPVDLNRCRDKEGVVRSRKVLLAALVRPGAFKGLLDLRRRSGLCAERLAAIAKELILRAR